MNSIGCVDCRRVSCARRACALQWHAHAHVLDCCRSPMGRILDVLYEAVGIVSFTTIQIRVTRLALEQLFDGVALSVRCATDHPWGNNPDHKWVFGEERVDAHEWLMTHEWDDGRIRDRHRCWLHWRCVAKWQRGWLRLEIVRGRKCHSNLHEGVDILHSPLTPHARYIRHMKSILRLTCLTYGTYMLLLTNHANLMYHIYAVRCCMPHLLGMPTCSHTSHGLHD